MYKNQTQIMAKKFTKNIFNEYHKELKRDNFCCDCDSKVWIFKGFSKKLKI